MPQSSRHEHLQSLVHFSPSTIREAMKDVEGFNAKLAVLITNGVGTMACAYLFAIIALISLPEVAITAGVIPQSVVPHVLANPGLILLVAWFAQTFLQLVLLAVIIVGQRVQAHSTEARDNDQYAHVTATAKAAEQTLDRLDTRTKGGLADVVDAIHSLGAALEPTRPLHPAAPADKRSGSW